MTESLAPWTTWNSADSLPCRFAREDAEANAAFLQYLLATDHSVESATTATANSLSGKWKRIDVNTFLELNALAEDLKLLQSKPLLAEVLRDLADPNGYLAARHTLRVAALFERAQTGAVKTFIEARNDTVPDFVVDLRGEVVPVEAKLLTKSQVEVAFERNAKNLVDHASALLNSQDEQDVGLFILLADATLPPDKARLTELLRSLLSRGVEVAAGRADGCHVQVERLKRQPGIRDQRTVYVMAPIHHKDYLRIRTPARTASKQLRSHIAHGAGILALGLHEHDGCFVFDFLNERMENGSFGGISAVILSKAYTHLQPPRRTVCDLLEIRKNAFAAKQLSSPILLKPLDLGVRLSEAEPSHTDQPVYRYAVAAGKVTGLSEGGVIGMPDIRRVLNVMVRSAQLG